MSAIASTFQPQAASVMFHHFCDAQHPRGQGAIDGDELTHLINAIGPDRILPAKEWLLAHERGALKPGQICLTFDDSLRCQFDVALPVLTRFGLTGFWFVYTCHLTEKQMPRLEIYRYFRTVHFATVDNFYETFFRLAADLYGSEVQEWLDDFDRSQHRDYPVLYSENDIRFQEMRDRLLGRKRYFAAMDQMLENYNCDTKQIAEAVMMSADNLRELHRDGHIVGMHSHTHPTTMNALSASEQAHEYWNNYDAITSIIGQHPIAMSHPSNSYDDRTLAILRSLGIRVGFRADPYVETACPLQRPRIDHMLLMREIA